MKNIKKPTYFVYYMDNDGRRKVVADGLSYEEMIRFEQKNHRTYNTDLYHELEESIYSNSKNIRRTDMQEITLSKPVRIGDRILEVGEKFRVFPKQENKKWQIYTVDVTGSKNSGWEINDRSNTGDYIELPSNVKDMDVIKNLIQADWLKSGITSKTVQIEDNGDTIDVLDVKTGKYLLQLEIKESVKIHKKEAKDYPKYDFKVGDKVVITLEGLQRHSRSIPAHMGYTPETMKWRNLLGGFLDKGIVGKITKIFPNSDNINVDFKGQTFGVYDYMIAPANSRRKEAKDKKGYEFEKANLIFLGVGMDNNGNKVARFTFPHEQAFSIQTNGKLPDFQRLSKGDFNITSKMEDDAIDYIRRYGSSKQKSSLKTYK